VAPNAHPDAERTPELPLLITSPVDVGRLIRELEQIDESLLQLGLRTGGQEVKMPKTSRLMDQTIELNDLNLLKPGDRSALKQFLIIVRQTAPVLHVSFGADPSVVFAEKLMTWLRQEIHPFTLITIGLQPNMGGGCIVRTTNHEFDFSLRRHFDEKKNLLIEQLAAAEQAA